MQKTISDKITIVVPCKNEENYIHHLLDSLRQQRWSCFICQEQWSILS